jgi:hypothetical protein
MSFKKVLSATSNSPMLNKLRLFSQALFATSAHHEITVNYSKTFNIIFIHIPKNGGTSVCRLLEIANSNHHTYQEYHASSFRVEHPLVQTFAIVRNPIDRFISLYKYARMPVSYYHNNISPELAKYGKHQDYEVLREVPIDSAVKLLHEGKLKHDASWLHWQPQVNWLTSSSSKQVGVNRLIRLEELHSQLPLVLGKTKFSVPVINNSYSKENIVLSSQSVKALREYYADDYSILGYK